MVDGVAHDTREGISFEQIAVKELRAKLDVRYVLSRPLSPSIHLHVGPGSVGVVGVPLDALPWQPTKSPPDAAGRAEPRANLR